MTEAVSQEMTDGKKLPTLPSGWAWASIHQIADTSSGGTPSRKQSTHYEGDIPWVKSGELQDSVITSTEEHLSETALQNSSAKLYPKNTLLVALYGATIGKLGILATEAATNQAVCAIFLPPQVSLYYMFYVLMHYRRALVEQGKGGAQPNISQGIVRETVVPLPPFNEQLRIVQKIEELFTKLDAGVRSLDQTQALLKIYRQSVLKAAVEGELSREWREAHKDELEPASELLARILQERREKFAGKQYKEPASPDTSKLPALSDGWEWSSLEQLDRCTE